MIIYNNEEAMNLWEEATSSFTWDPRVGDEGHVEDHQTIAVLIRDLPMWSPMYRMYAKSASGEWDRYDLGANGDMGDPSPSDWDSLVREANIPGVKLTSDDVSVGNGVTDHAEEPPGEVYIYCIYAGLQGAAAALLKQRMYIIELAERIEALEAG